MNPAQKRLAVLTEDHPFEFGKFQGEIPEGQYGAGTVHVWDSCTFEVVGPASASEQLQKGELRFTLTGRQLRGGFVLIRAEHLSRGKDSPEKNWLLIKSRDSNADPNWEISRQD